jgi:hypothetical protein
VAPDWLNNEIVTGLQKLLALRLPGSPAKDTAAATTTVWLEVIGGSGVDWIEALDRLRVRAAFRGLAARCDRWPAPRQFFEQLQPRAYAQPALTAKPSAAEMNENRKRIRNMVKQFKQQHTM